MTELSGQMMKFSEMGMKQCLNKMAAVLTRQQPAKKKDALSDS